MYARVSSVDQDPQTQLSELRQYAAHRGLQVVGEYCDHGFSGVRARRPQLDKMMEDARRRRFDVLLVWSCDRLARSAKHLLQTIDELSGMGIEFLSQREAIDTEGPLGRAVLRIERKDILWDERNMRWEAAPSGRRPNDTPRRLAA